MRRRLLTVAILVAVLFAIVAVPQIAPIAGFVGMVVLVATAINQAARQPALGVSRSWALPAIVAAIGMGVYNFGEGEPALAVLVVIALLATFMGFSAFGRVALASIRARSTNRLGDAHAAYVGAG